MEPETEETFEKRKKFLGHISYELKNMRECYFILKSSNPGPIIEVAPNLLIVAFSTHARNLIEFFKKEPDRKDERSDPARAVHYAPNLTAEEAKKICPEIDDWYKALCNHLSHLDYSRNEDTSSPFKIAYPIYSALKKILIQFKKYIEPQYKSSQLMELIKVMEQE